MKSNYGSDFYFLLNTITFSRNFSNTLYLKFGLAEEKSGLENMTGNAENTISQIPNVHLKILKRSFKMEPINFLISRHRKHGKNLRLSVVTLEFPCLEKK